jgi:phosphoribosylformylglycinamidine synthase
MSRFTVALHIVPRRGLLDPQGKAVADALHTLGFQSVEDVHVGRHVIVELKAQDAKAAEKEARAMCQKLLANPVTEDFQIAEVRAS